METLSEDSSLKGRFLQRGLFFVLIVLGGVFFFQPGLLKFSLFFSSPKKTHFMLIPPPSQRSKKNNVFLKSEVEQKIKRGVSFFAQAEAESYMQAQREWAQAAQGKRYKKEILALLCLSYFEIWPYTSQKSKELESVRKAWIQVSSIDPVSLQAFVCEQVYWQLKGRYKEAGFLINKLEDFSSSSSLPLEKKLLSFLYYVRALDLKERGRMDEAFESLSQAQSLWPKWFRLYRVQADFLRGQTMSLKLFFCIKRY